MKQIESLFELYKDTLQKCGLYLLEADNEIIEYNIYEEFDIGVHSFLHEKNLLDLYENGFISLLKMNKSAELRDKFIQLQNSEEWSIKNFRDSENWKNIMLLSDEIKSIS